MTIIVKHHKTGDQFIFLGTGFGAWKATRPSLFGGNLIPSEKQGTVSMVAVCDEIGRIGWLDSDDLIVVSIDGKSPKEIHTV